MRNYRLIPNYDPQSVLAKVDYQDEGCWEWQGNIDKYGYGTYGNQNHMVHRVVYQLLIDELRPDETVDHLCYNRSCVNPDHLETVPLAVNVMRGNNPYAVNARKTECLNGHEFTEANTYIHPQRGSRHCKACNNQRSRNYYLKEQRHGHKFGNQVRSKSFTHHEAWSKD